MSAWGFVPDDLDFTFPPLWTPTAMETATIAKTKSEATIAGFQAGLLQADTAMKELKKLEDETGMFGSLSDEEITAAAGKSYQDVTALRDPLMGLELGGEEAAPFDRAAQDAVSVKDYSPSQPRDKNGRWTGGSGSGKIEKTKYAPSPQRNHGGLQLKPKIYARLTGTLNTQYPGLEAGEVRYIRDAKRLYKVEADGYGGMKVLSSRKIK